MVYFISTGMNWKQDLLISLARPLLKYLQVFVSVGEGDSPGLRVESPVAAQVDSPIQFRSWHKHSVVPR